jgi:hypothetical protein
MMIEKIKNAARWILSATKKSPSTAPQPASPTPNTAPVAERPAAQTPPAPPETSL